MDVKPELLVWDTGGRKLRQSTMGNGGGGILISEAISLSRPYYLYALSRSLERHDLDHIGSRDGQRRGGILAWESLIASALHSLPPSFPISN